MDIKENSPPPPTEGDNNSEMPDGLEPVSPDSNISSPVCDTNTFEPSNIVDSKIVEEEKVTDITQNTTQEKNDSEHLSSNEVELKNSTEDLTKSNPLSNDNEVLESNDIDVKVGEDQNEHSPSKEDKPEEFTTVEEINNEIQTTENDDEPVSAPETKFTDPEVNQDTDFVDAEVGPENNCRDQEVERDNPNMDFECSDTTEHLEMEDVKTVQNISTDVEMTPADEAMEVSNTTEMDPFDQVASSENTEELKDEKFIDTTEAQLSESDNKNEIKSVESNEISSENHDEHLPPQNESQTENLNEAVNDIADDNIIAVDECDDFEESQGADEELCLLPDSEREISQADKERAILAKETLAKEAATKETSQDSSSVFDSLMNNEEAKSVVDDIALNNTTEVPNDVMDAPLANDIPEENNLVNNEINEVQKEQDEKDMENESIDVIETDIESSEPLTENVIQETVEVEQKCVHCQETKQCKYHLLIEGEIKYLCQNNCVRAFQEQNVDKYTLNIKKIVIKEIVDSEHTCDQCKEFKDCKFEFGREEKKNICTDECLKVFKNDTLAKCVVKYKKVVVQEIAVVEQICKNCCETKEVKFHYNVNSVDLYICNEDCLEMLQEQSPDKYKLKVRKVFRVKENARLMNAVSPVKEPEGPTIVARSEEDAEAARLDRERSFIRKCFQCDDLISGEEKNLSWETMDFCNEDCLGKYQNVAHANCSNCKTRVQAASLGKYCVRFGYDIRQFCCSGCLEEFKKGLKVCSYCQKDISGGYEGFLAPVGDQGQFKDFCTQACMEKYDQMSNNSTVSTLPSLCAVCKKEKAVRVEVSLDGHDHKLCSNPCFSAFKFVNKVFPDQCEMCKKYSERKSTENFTIYQDSIARTFCSKTCMNVFILSNRKIVPCNWCKVKKYNFDMIKKELSSGQTMMMCSLNCLTLYQVSVNAVSMRRIKCDHCKSLSQAQYHLTMSDATIRNFCTYQCVMSFQNQYSKSPITLSGEPPATATKSPVPTGAPKRTYHSTSRKESKVTTKNINKSVSNKSKVESYSTPVISNVHSLAQTNQTGHHTRGAAKAQAVLTPQKVQPPASPKVQPAPKPQPPPKPLPPPKPQFKTQLIIKPPIPPMVANMSTMCKPITHSKSVSCRPHLVNKECQTDDSLQRRVLIPIPVPIYVPTPINMYSTPFPVPVPIPIPIPIPVFIPTTRNSATGIMKEIKKIHEKMPTDPFEAEILMMAEMVAGDKKRSESDSESEEDAPEDDGFSPEGIETSNTFGEDMLQIALKMATEYDEPAVDLESAMTASTITPSSHPPLSSEENVDDPNPMQHHHHMLMMEQHRAAMRGRKRPARPQASSTPNKRSRRSSNTVDMPQMMQPPPQPEPPREPAEKPDANMCLKYTFGVNAWKQWVMTKNADLEKSSIRRKPFKSEILQLTADELNYSLCLFVKEVRKPNGSEYAPDTIYYLVLGIQQYLFENGRIDNIFTDAYYEKFTECLDEVAKKFSVLYNDSQYIVTRVEEEHLWESKQLGAHSPHVLLSTLMFFNTKHFNLVTVEEHMQLSFSHIMKHWKRNPNQPGAAKVPGSRNVLLRFYPPQAALEANSRKKKVYEQQENEDNPLRCPVKLYEFYLSKCPESVKTRNDVFYLLPERSCVPDSPVWYSTMALGKEPLMKMLHRVKMVKEINIALLTS